MKILSLIFVVLFVVPGHASQDESSLHLYFLNPEMRYEKGNSQELVDRKPVNTAVAYRFKNVSALVEYTHFDEQTGNETSMIERNHKDLSLWLRAHFFTAQNHAIKTSLFGGLGVGSYEEEVQTTLLGVSQTDRSSAKPFAGLVVGAEMAFSVTEYFGFLVGAEARSLAAPDFTPNPLWSAVLRLGLQFSL